MNKNQIITDRWSNEDSQKFYELQWPDEPKVREQYEQGQQCGGCAFFAPFNFDWGLCCYAASRHHLETVFEHFTCPVYIHEGWEAHSFSDFDLDAMFEGSDDDAERHNEHQP